ncbi:hypothetical protein SAMN04490357_7507 [Streptomyces misionensis]|uniref:Uncharacterized protein n=1 Tax=Streptomyces misionensis TaxID=67331 RepID=A0A1H5HIB8_9ACTN|nr:hypothetical protein SAMN04490357_7507 [Streptomyces misionensis]
MLWRGVGHHGIDDLGPEFARSVVAHVGNEQETRARHQVRGAFTAAGIDQRVIQAVDHQRRHPESAQFVRA